MISQKLRQPILALRGSQRTKVPRIAKVRTLAQAKKLSFLTKPRVEDLSDS